MSVLIKDNGSALFELKVSQVYPAPRNMQLSASHSDSLLINY